MCPEHVARAVPHHQHRGALVTHPGNQLLTGVIISVTNFIYMSYLQGARVCLRAVEEAPVLPVLQQQGSVDEEDRGVVQTRAVLLRQGIRG